MRETTVFFILLQYKLEFLNAIRDVLQTRKCDQDYGAPPADRELTVQAQATARGEATDGEVRHAPPPPGASGGQHAAELDYLHLAPSKGAQRPQRGAPGEPAHVHVCTSFIRHVEQPVALVPRRVCQFSTQSSETVRI